MPETLPQNLEAERMVLGSILLDGDLFPEASGTLTPDSFSLEKHRRIFRRMAGLYERGERIDRITLHNELLSFNEVESCDGLSYLVSLDDGLPRLPSIDSYIRIVSEKSVLRDAIHAAQNLMNRCMMAEDNSVDILAEAEAAIQSLARAQTKHGQWVNPGEIITAYPGGLQGFLNPASSGIGIPTPWMPITEKLGGLKAGDLFIVAGRPSMGKSLVAMQIAHHAAAHNEPAAVFSLEMSKESLVQRVVAGLARVDAQLLRTGRLDVEGKKRAARAAGDISYIPLMIDDTRARTVSAMSAALRKLNANDPRLEGKRIRVIVIDHLQLMTGGARRESNRHAELSDILHALKYEAGTMGATVVLLSQLNRQCEIDNRRPQLSDLKETGTIEEDADVVLFIHRPERYVKNHGREELRGLAEFIVAKQREGPTGKRDMVFLDSIQKFECRAEDTWEQGE